MVATIEQIIGKINPKLYASNGDELLKKYGSADKIPAEEVKPNAVKYSEKGGIIQLDSGGVEAKHVLGYNASSETLEPIYFFILDLMKDDFGLDVEKLIDNFSSSPGSGHFSEMNQKATIMQQQGSKLMVDINMILRSVLNIVYDLKEFKIRLQTYDDLKDKNKKDAALLSLKQIWMDKVDINKGNSSIKAMALGQAGFQTLIDAFLVAKNQDDVKKIDLNDRVKRILIPRIAEFNTWVQHSENELRKRYEIERNYLKSQVNSLKLYSRWAKPQLRAAQQLEMKEGGRDPALVKSFNTIILELSLLGKSKLDVKNSALAGDLPSDLKNLNQKRNYYSCVLVDFRFVGIPQKISQQQHYVFGGKAVVSFKAYALNEDEIKKINEELDKSDVGDVLRFLEGSTTESLGQLQKDIDFFLQEKEEIIEKPKTGSNPFLALIGYYNESGKQEKKPEIKQAGEIVVTKDNWVESYSLRPLVAERAKNAAFDLFNIYKKAHGMPSYI
ncbi:MAG: hypothetical protein KJ646_00605 [Nanoarchaeota archaeon]|nr:hypothetical protein [Nanoarchaeota archaeon]MBU4116993.1 hypothetical protein [Nanoarchaeota archaeon]